MITCINKLPCRLEHKRAGRFPSVPAFAIDAVTRGHGHAAIMRLMALWLVTLVALTAVEAPLFRSPATLVADQGGTTLYVAESTALRVAVMDAVTGQVRREITMPDAPGGLCLSQDGRRLFVAGAVPEGRIHVVEVESGRITSSWAVGHTPLSPVLSPDGSRLYVCNQFDNEVAVLDCGSGTVIGRVPVVREPMAAVLTPNGRDLVVINRLPYAPATADLVAAQVTLIDTTTLKSRHITLPNGATSLEGVCLSPDGSQAYVTHLLARFQQPTTQLERGWMNTNALSIIDVNGAKLIATVLLDRPDRGAANPWGVACAADGSVICVAHAGTHEVSIIDRPALLGKIAAAASTDVLSYDLSFMTNIRRLIKLGGLGPRGLLLTRDRIFVAEYFSDSVGVVPLVGLPSAVAHTWPLGPVQPLTQVRRGELAFYDASRCFQQWQSCSSCHPGSRTDGLNWDLLNDGLGNPKNVRSMLLAHRTPPSMSLGVRENAEKSVRSGFRFIENTVIDEETATAVDVYLAALAPVRSPHLKQGTLSPQQEQGRNLFTTANCISCHKPPLYTNLKRYDLGTTRGMDEGHKVDVPTLIEVWRTAPYLHDGRALTLPDIFSPANNPEGIHGHVEGLTAEQLDALFAYVLTL